VTSHSKQLPVLPATDQKHVHYDWLGANEPKNGIKQIDIPFVMARWPMSLRGLTTTGFDQKCTTSLHSEEGADTTHRTCLGCTGAYSH